jgi:tRNA U34 5-carboxymethylaminomethyl modifying GTPase MnmE/TrmE
MKLYYTKDEKRLFLDEAIVVYFPGPHSFTGEGNIFKY